MKSIVAINTAIPTAERTFGYLSGASLRDYDIVVFDPEFPDLSRIDFSGGGSCFTVEATDRLIKAISHWSSELDSALKAGKTIFILLNSYIQDQGATGSTSKGNQRTYNTSVINNYMSIPVSINLTNSNGEKLIVSDSSFKSLYESIKDICHYRVVIDTEIKNKTFSARDGSTIGGYSKIKDYDGTIVFLPYFSFDEHVFREKGESGKYIWSKEALAKSNALISQLVAVDKNLRSSFGQTPPPSWMGQIPMPAVIRELDQEIAALDGQINELQTQRAQKVGSQENMLNFTHLLYEKGKPLERAIESALSLLGYSVETLRIGDLEIDHVIVSPSGKRMIGESEGKDNAAIDISKFRQLESNIGEDFERDEIDEPAKGILLGNGFRLSPPNEREEQFTQKSLINAKRLGSALIRTSDLYSVAVHLLDKPDDEAYKEACRTAIEEAAGEIVRFPKD